MTIMRDYQDGSIKSVFDYWGRGGGNPLVVMATGLGKSVVFGKVTETVAKSYAGMRILMLVHVRELVRQNYTAIKNIWPEGSIGIYSAGLGRRETRNRVICAGIQSVYNKAREIGPFDLVIIDEAHLVPKSGAGMYLTLLNDLRKMTPDLRVLGLTATPFRLDTGRLDRGDDRMFDEIVYDYGIRDGIADGWLSPITAKQGGVEIDVRGVAKRGGEFVAGALEDAAMDEDLITAACKSMCERAADRNSWLTFCSGVKHAYTVAECLRGLGIDTQTITGETPSGERDEIVSAFKAGRIRCLTNANVLTTGFDAPGVDLISFLRPTLSTGLYVQMLGRGTRPIYEPGFNPNAATAEERKISISNGPKGDCLVLDFAGNVRRHGPVDMVQPTDKKAKKGDDEGKVGVNSVMAKDCPECAALVALAAMTCPTCGYEFPRKDKHDKKPDQDIAVISTEVERAGLPVKDWTFNKHVKANFDPDLPPPTPTLKVTFFAGLGTQQEWICFEHTGIPLRKAHEWWMAHGGSLPVPHKIEDALRRIGELTMPAELYVQPDGKWTRIVGRKFAQPVIQKVTWQEKAQ